MAPIPFSLRWHGILTAAAKATVETETICIYDTASLEACEGIYM